MMQTQCLLEGGPSTRLNVKVRCFQIVNRTIGKVSAPLNELPAEPEFEVVDYFEVNGQTFMPWQETAEREVILPSLHPASLLHNELFQFRSGRELEPPRDEDDRIVGIVIREWERLSSSMKSTQTQARTA